MCNVENRKDYITILMPVYNAAEFVREAVESILSQSYPYFEFLIIDDGSTDDTLAVIRSISDERIRLLVHPQNQGLQFTLNEGLRLASCDLIARMDADDISHPWRIEKQVDYMRKNPGCAMVDCWVKVMDKQGQYIRSEGIYSRYVYYTLAFECCIYHSAVLYRKKALRAVGGYKLEYAEDYDLFWRLSRRFKIHTIEEHLLWYRIHDKNLNTVSKKTEYDEYSRQVWQRNIQYYMGERRALPVSWMACYFYDFAPLLQEGNLKSIYRCISFLDEISAKMISVENPNRNLADIRYIGNFKKQYIIRGLAAQLPFGKMWKLWLHYRQGKNGWKSTLKRGIKLFTRQNGIR